MPTFWLTILRIASAAPHGQLPADDIMARVAANQLLGTNLAGVGFSVNYQRQPDGVWFPAGFGTEFRLRALFFLKRDISI